MPTPHAPAALKALASEWIAAWNARDLERVLKLYTDDSEMTSRYIVGLGFDASGTLHGKDRMRAYWTKALTLRPQLHFTLIEAFIGPDSVIVHYQNEFGKQVCEYLRLDEAGKISQASGNYPVE